MWLIATAIATLTGTEGQARPSCKSTNRCKAEGRCSYDPVTERCSVRSRSDCRQSALCRNEARCSYDKKNGCVAKSSADCRLSLLCKRDGKCSREKNGGACVAKRASDCLASTRCKREGACSYAQLKSGKYRGPSWGACIAGKDADCRRSQACKKRKHCWVNPQQLRSRGAPCSTRPDCSYDCEKYGRCTARDGRCIALTSKDCHGSTACTSEQICISGNSRSSRQRSGCPNERG